MTEPPRGEFITCAEIATDNFQCFIIHTGGYLKEKFWEINNNDAPASCFAYHFGRCSQQCQSDRFFNLNKIL